MSKELTPLEAFYELGDNTPITDAWKIVETALKRNIELEEENKVLKTIKDNFYLWVEPNYRATLQLLQCCSMTPSEYEKFIEYFGEPRDE